MREAKFHTARGYTYFILLPVHTYLRKPREDGEGLDGRGKAGRGTHNQSEAHTIHFLILKLPNSLQNSQARSCCDRATSTLILI